MLATTLIPETISQSDGAGTAIEIAPASARLYVLTLGITRAVEQESIHAAVWGSPDGEDWGNEPLAVLPPKYYCGVYSVLLNLASHPRVRFIRLQWRMERWGRPDAQPMFGFYSFLEESGARLAAAVA